MEETGRIKTSLGLDENIEGLLCYVLGWVTGIAFIVLEKESRFVRFHAMQSLVTFLAISAAGIVLGIIPFIGWLLLPFLWLSAAAIWIICMFKAFKGEWFKLPVAGNYADDYVRRENIGQQKSAVCPHCGAAVRDDARFCEQCGAKL
mgnify:CR=1 FL=1